MLTNEDVKAGIGGMILEIWNLQKQIRELQTELEQLKQKLDEYKEKKK